MEIKMGNQIQTEATIYVRFNILELNKISKSKSKSYIDQITSQINECTLELQATYFQKIIFFLNQHDMKEKIIIID